MKKLLSKAVGRVLRPYRRWWKRSRDNRTVNRHDRYVRYENNVFDLHHPRSNSALGKALITETYEGKEIDLIRRHVKPEDRVLELGSCAGVTSLVIVDIVGRDEHIVFEPDERNFEFSQYHFALNRKDVRIERALLISGDEVAESVSFRSNANPSSSSLLQRSGTDSEEQVTALRFEDVIARERPNFLVLDIEGAEYELFMHAGEFGSLSKIILETHAWILGEDKVDEMLAHLRSHGFGVVDSMNDHRYLVLERHL